MLDLYFSGRFLYLLYRKCFKAGADCKLLGVSGYSGDTCGDAGEPYHIWRTDADWQLLSIDGVAKAVSVEGVAYGGFCGGFVLFCLDLQDGGWILGDFWFGAYKTAKRTIQ